MGCTLSAYGAGFDVDGFLRTSPLKVDDVWHEGEPTGTAGSFTKSSGLRIDILDDALDDFAAQKNAAMTFLHENRHELQQLAQAVGDRQFALKFGIRLREDIAVWVDGIPPELSRLAGDVGCWITISHYPPNLDRIESYKPVASRPNDSLP
jgi:hypothetical protein